MRTSINALPVRRPDATQRPSMVLAAARYVVVDGYSAAAAIDVESYNGFSPSSARHIEIEGTRTAVRLCAPGRSITSR